MPGASAPCPTYGLGKLPSSLGTGSSSQRSLDFAGMLASLKLTSRVCHANSGTVLLPLT